ncbi:MAG TPA: virulence-associated E family protein [Bryobacteraceae bacterium]|nr:virulence-associated E family protein [Bryobacteraceae bacterium]
MSATPDIEQLLRSKFEEEKTRPPQRVDSVFDWRAALVTNRDGVPFPVLANAITALRHAPEWGGVLALNEFSLGVTAMKPAPWGGPAAGSGWTDQEDRLAADWLQRVGIRVSIETAGAAVQTVAQDRTFHPVRQYLDSLKWDGTKRIDTWLALYLGAESNDYTAAVGARWLISAVARIYRPGCKSDCCLILEGEQGTRKSTALATIAGDWFTDEIAELGSKDAALQTRGVWIIEIAELDSMTRGEVSRIKGFMSRATDRFRPPYGKRIMESPRQCVFAGSVNHSTYLRDETGGRRFWPVACTRILIDDLARDRDQLWAEAVARYRAGASWWLDSVELNRRAEQEQAARFEGGPWDELIGQWTAARETVSVGDVLTFCIEKPKANWTQADKNVVARALRAIGWERYRERTGNSLEWRYRRKP